MAEFSVTVDVRGGREVCSRDGAEERVGALLCALERRPGVLGPVAHLAWVRGVIGARFNVRAASPTEAWGAGLGIFREALGAALPDRGTDRWPLDAGGVVRYRPPVQRSTRKWQPQVVVHA